MHIKKELGPMLYYFGYVNHPSEENQNAYFHFEEHEEANLAQYYRFRSVSKHFKEHVADNAKQANPKVYQYKICNAETGFDLLTPKANQFIQTPAKQEARKALGYPVKENIVYPKYD